MYKADFPAVDEAAGPVDGSGSHSRRHDHAGLAHLPVVIEHGGHGMRSPDLDRSSPINLNDRVVLALASAALNGRIVWLNGEDYGIALDNQFNDVLNGARENGSHAAMLTDIAAQGAEIANDANFQPGLRVQVILSDGSEKDGLVRWSRDNIAGVVLLQSSPDKLCSMPRPIRSDHP